MKQDKSIHWVQAFGFSALVHVGAFYFVIDFLDDIRIFAPAEEAAPDLLVTSLVLDAQTLAAATETAGGADGDAGEGLEIEEPDAVESESLQGVAEEPESAEPVTPEEEITPETPEPVEPEIETPQAVEPEVETPAPVEPEPAIAEAVEPEPAVPDLAEAEPETLQPVEEPAAVSPEPLSPLRPDEDSIAALAPVDGGGPTALAPVTSDGPERLTATAPATTTATVAPLDSTSTTRIAPVSNTPRVSAPAPRRPAVEPPAPGSPAAVVSELVAKIRASVADPCLVAMPQQAADGSPELVMLAADEAGITQFAQTVLEGIDPRPGQRGVLIDPRQCPAATYVRENASYPAFRLSLGVTTDVVNSGEELRGAVGRAGGNYVTLLLIDDNGVVQDLGQYLSFAGGEARFSVPVRRDGSARDTSQMLVALASDRRPATLDTQNGQLAEDFFPALRAELGTGIPLVMIPFDVR